MSSYEYFDREPIVLKRGIHGIGPKFAEELTTGLVRIAGPEGDSVMPLYVVPNESVDVTHGEVPASRQHCASEQLTSIYQPGIVEFISFGHSHRYYARDYPDVAPYWRNNLLSEARILGRALQGDQATAYEFLEGQGDLGAWMADGIRGVQDWFRKGQIPKPENYDPLMQRVWDTFHRVKSATAGDYAVLHEAGLELERIRYQQAFITRQVQGRVNELIDSAGWGLTAATEVESASFTVLDLYGQVRYPAQPASLAAYRCGVAMVRAGARYAGEKIAGSSQRAALKEAGVILRADFPKAVTGLLQGYIKQGFENPLAPSAKDEFAEQLIGIQIWLAFYTVDYFVFVEPDLPAAEKGHYFEKVAPEFGLQVFGAIVAIGMTRANGMPADSGARIWLGRLAAALPALVGAVLHEYLAMRDMAKREQRPFYEVFCSELGWALIRILKAVGLALAQAPVKEWMQVKMAADRNFWCALFLRIKLALAEVDVSRLAAQEDRPALVWNQKLPKTPGGPDKNGNTGINKFRPAAAGATPLIATKPPKLARAARQKVQIAPKVNLRKGEEFSKPLKRVILEINASDVARKWKEFEGKAPHYICESCGFVNCERGMFNIDHVWDIQHGGKALTFTADELRKMVESSNPAALYERGVNWMVLCKGCNLAKNTEFDSAPGKIPDDAGYARTKHDEDQNPQHVYDGGPGRSGR